MKTEISYVVKQEGGGGVKLYVVTVDGRYATEAVQRVKYRLEPTAPIKVEGPANSQAPWLALIQLPARSSLLVGETWGRPAAVPLSLS